MRLSLDCFVECDKLISCLGIAILIFNQYAADTVALDHVDQVSIQRSAIKLNDDHLSQFLIQAHSLHNAMCQVTVRYRNGSWSWCRRQLDNGSCLVITARNTRERRTAATEDQEQATHERHGC